MCCPGAVITLAAVELSECLLVFYSKLDLNWKIVWKLIELIYKQ